MRPSRPDPERVRELLAQAPDLVERGHDLLIAGIRPEAFEDATVLDTSVSEKGSTFKTTVDVVEWLGNEAYAYVPFEAPAEVQEQLDQLERDLDGEAMRTQLVVSLDGNSKIAAGSEATIWVDSSKIHLFDPKTGRNLTVEHAPGAPEVDSHGDDGGPRHAGETDGDQPAVATPPAGEQDADSDEGGSHRDPTAE